MASSSKRKKRRRQVNLLNGGLLKYAGIVVAIGLVIFLVGLGGGVSHGSPEKVVTSLWKAYGQRKEKLVIECYGKKEKDMEEEKDLQLLISSTMDFINAHKAKSIEVKDCDVLSDSGDVYYVYVIYELVIDDDMAYPCLSTHMVRKSGKSYYVLPPSEITESLQQRATSDFEKFTTMDTYDNFMMEYVTFIKKNPGYEDTIAGLLGG